MARKRSDSFETPVPFAEPLTIQEVAYLQALVAQHARHIARMDATPLDPVFDPNMYPSFIVHTVIGKLARSLEVANTHYMEIPTTDPDSVSRN